MYDTKGVEVFYVDGIKFHLDEKSGYYGGYFLKKKIRLHRYIWEKYNGEIPKGHHVHHKDKNKFNNNIDNLIVLSASEHEKLHELLRSEDEKSFRKKNLECNARPKAIEWHGSEDGIEWHRTQGRKVAKKLKDVTIQKFCKLCKNQFTDNGFNKALFCSNKCKSKWRRLNGVDNERRICLICGGEYECNKYDKTKTCSNRCGSILSQKNRKGESN